MQRPSHDPARTFWPALFSSESVEWATPIGLVNALSREFGPFDLDPCATADNAKAPKFYTLETDGLAQPWAPARVFLNPPYGRLIGKWMRKARLEAERGAVVVAVIHARTDTRWWHLEVEPHAALIRFLRGRVRFVLPDGSTGTSPFPSVVVVYGISSQLGSGYNGWTKK